MRKRSMSQFHSLSFICHFQETCFDIHPHIDKSCGGNKRENCWHIYGQTADLLFCLLLLLLLLFVFHFSKSSFTKCFTDIKTKIHLHIAMMSKQTKIKKKKKDRQK